MAPEALLHFQLRKARRELREARRELSVARQALQHRHPRARSAGDEDIVRALSVVLQHSASRTLDQVLAERDRLEELLAGTRASLRAAQDRYTSLRYEVWQISENALTGRESPEEALLRLSAATEDSEDERRFQEESAWR
jgi:hypothetical protein